MKLTENPHQADRYLNLRECDGHLVVTGMMSAVPGQTFTSPQLCRIEGSSVYDCIVWQSGSGIATGVSADGSLSDPLVVLSSPPLSALAHPDGSMTVFTKSERIRIVKDGDRWRPVYDASSFPVAGIRPSGQATVSVTVDRYQLKSSDDLRAGQVSSADTAVITRNILGAYSALRRKATGAGRCIMPVFVRYRLLDSGGNLLYLSNPQLIVSDNRSRLGVIRPLDITSPAVEAYDLAAESFGIAIHLPDDQSAAMVSVMIVETTPEIDMVDFGAQASVAVNRDASGKYDISVGMPFLSDQLYRSVLSGSVDSLERLFVPVARITEPFGHGDRTVTVRASGGMAVSSYADIADRLRELVLSVNNTRQGNLAMVSVPNSFTAAYVATGGPVTLYAGVSALRFCGYGAESFALSVSDEPWRSAVTVKNAVYDVSGAVTDWVVPVILTVVAPVSSTAPASVVRSKGMGRLLSIDLDVRSEQTAGMEVEIFAGDGAGDRMARFIISSGSLVSPLLFNVASRRVSSVAVTVSGGMIPGTSFGSITVNRKRL